MPLLFALSGLAQPSNPPATNGPPWETSDIGAVWSDNFIRAALGTNWVILGSANASIVGNELRFVQTNADTSRQVYYQPWLTSSDQWTLRWSQRFGTLDANSAGVGAGLKNFQAAGGNSQGYNALLCGAGSNLGRMILERWDGTTQNLVASGQALALAAGDEVDCLLTRAGWTISATASNRANGLVSAASVVFSRASPQNIPPISRICFYPLGGDVSVTNLSFAINHRKPARFVVIGASIGEGDNASTYSQGFVRVVQSNVTEVVCNESGSWNGTSNALSLLPEILAHQPGMAILTVGANDLTYGYPASQWQGNYSNLVAQLQTNGVKVKHCLPTPETSTDQRPFKNWLLASYPASDIIDHWTPFVVNGYQLASKYDGGDGVHLNDAGHLLMGQIILSNLPPSISAQPRSLTMAASADAFFTVSATAATPLAYQWQFNGTNISGATDTGLAVANVQETNAGNYTVVVINSAGATTSFVASLTVGLPLNSMLVALLPDRNPLLTFSGATNLSCRIDISTDLFSWTTLTNMPNPDGTLQFFDPYATNFARRFYRVFSLP